MSAEEFQAAPVELDYDAPSEDEARLIELVGFLVQGLSLIHI